jgi:hypothetical protein
MGSEQMTRVGWTNREQRPQPNRATRLWYTSTQEVWTKRTAFAGEYLTEKPTVEALRAQSTMPSS